ncbi:copper amine oxidase N-terminal domain-containing protein [Brevibacillus choshinensis]|uniref:Copper amine oxidase-like N-terminal domain-containing protein n=1 Tax=Brevibacillus choshinensis TaxID=54911 RepID=A0ABX7FWR9_BRECH|nr:copper amine oxidase N-terminal domain-containing protein [Brevibacillus choshinensis]QRG69685.1 hypothetical protein JNE38_11505 [Brevibacillus choshinensis]
MKNFVWGLIIGAALASSTVAFASSSILAYLFPVQFEINGQSVPMSKEVTVLKVDGRAYVPIRFIADHLGATIGYEDAAKKIIIKNQMLDITDPAYKSISAGNLIVTKDGNRSMVTGQIQLSGVGNTQNSVEAALSFYDAENQKLGEAVISGTQFGADVQTFVTYANGDLRGYRTVILHVKAVNKETVADEKGIVYENKDYAFGLTLPKSWEGNFEIMKAPSDGTEMTYHFIDRPNKAYGGVIFTLSVWKRADWQENGGSILEAGRTKKLGEKGEFVFTLSRPGDVQYDLEDESLAEEYAQMSSFVERIATSFRVR